MALDNLISVSFTDAELLAIDNALTALETAFAGKVINLTPEDRQQYGKIGNNTENWINKVQGYMNGNASLIPNYLDKTEHDKDYKFRQVVQPRLNRLTSVFEGLDDTQKLVSADLWHNSISFYRNIKIASQQNVPGSTAIYQDLKAQFPGRPKKGTSVPPTS